MPIVLFTLYQRDTSEGILRHFESVIKTLLDNKTLLSVWKMPVRCLLTARQTKPVYHFWRLFCN